MDILENLQFVSLDTVMFNDKNTRVNVRFGWHDLIRGKNNPEEINNYFSHDEKIFILYDCIRNKQSDEFLRIFAIFDGINLSNEEENLLLNWACANDMFDVVKFLVEYGVNVTNNLLIKIAACYNNKANIIKYLVESGANPHLDNEYALCMAINQGNVDIFNYLLKCGCNISARNNYCIKRCVAKKLPIYFLNTLIEYGADIHCDSDFLLKEAIYNNDIVSTIKLLQYGVNVSCLSTRHLLHIIKNGDYELVKLLIDYGINFSQINNEKIKETKNERKINLLLTQGVDFTIVFKLLGQNQLDILEFSDS
ncbi:ankyrin repeat protein [Moumouvirus australiensis]|uniref:Ankyrin repeat protein n=1 Tax=Moumouvirus australiensis TaxID=2109587 RepID=A0A2P1EKY3_9VIRU|nr:ankyrin repeat protein [Moumouvirus australiensis]AVL94527.1 ankyrin repeat protein [Moumouvirus australiensis]